MTATTTEPSPEASHVESRGPFHRVLVDRGAFFCFPPALFDNVASEARDHCGNFPLSVANYSERTYIFELATTFYCSFCSGLRSVAIIWYSRAAVIINFSLNPASSGHVALSYHFPVGILFSRVIFRFANISRGIVIGVVCGIVELFQDSSRIQ